MSCVVREQNMELVILGVFLLFGSGACQIKSVPECNDAEIEACGEQFVAFAHGPRVAETLSELEESCRLELKGLACARNYAERCLVGFFRGAAFTALTTLKEETDRKCDSSHPNHKRYLENAHCLNKAGERIHKCVEFFKEELYTVALKSTTSKRIPYGCCAYNGLFRCKQESLEQACGDPKTILLVHETAEHVLGDLVKVFCGRYESGSTDCKSLGKLQALAANETAPRSFILLLKAFVTTLP
ncbi:unnamed protein product [Ixodes persulcatus]